MVQKEEGVIVKVNKQWRRVVEVLLSFYHSRGGVGPAERVVGGGVSGWFSRPCASVGFPPLV